MSRAWGTHSSGAGSRTLAGPSVVGPRRRPGSADRGQVRTVQYCTDLRQRLFESVEESASRPGDSHPWGSGGPGTFGFPADGGYAPGYGVSFRPFIAYDAVEPFDTSLSLDKRRAWCDKFQYTASSGGWREHRFSHNPGTKAWMQQLPELVRRSWRQLSDRFYKEFCRSTESPVERYLRGPGNARTFLWRLNAAATKTNVDFHSASGCRRHVKQFLKNLRDRELQLSLQGRVYFTTDELKDVLKQVEEMERGMRRKPANDVQFGRHKPQGVGPGITTRGGGGAYAAVANPEVPEPPQALDTEGLRWEDEDDSGYGYQYDEENDEGYDSLVDQEEKPRGLGMTATGVHDPRGGGPAGASKPSVPCPVCNKPGHTRERCWQLMKCDRCGGKHPTNQCCRRRECEACCQLHPAGECAVIKAFKEAAQRGQLQGLPEEVLQRLRPETTPALNN
ncbi:hypothetical protein PHMEG_00027567 [Phytophthora megakarya]|uniref:Retrotransposon gag domain-containing protein n=1 Tax=Phytophthora megakarya TaxID=4795 RepID=A0A225V7M8_9STRA|nr:hypothetical protein PHMEG_00027567 [Phytophthora megakarya]